MMILPIGSNSAVRRAPCVLSLNLLRNTKKGVTLIEAMISVSILSIGLTLILQGFTYCLNGLRVSENNLKASLMAGNLMAGSQIQAKEDWDKFKEGLSERFEIERLKCTWDTEVNPAKREIEDDEEIPRSYNDLNELSASFVWKEGRRKGKVSLVTYMRSPENE